MGVAIEEVRGCHTPPISSLSASLPNINGARQRCIADKTRGKSYLSANWALTNSFFRKIGVVHPTNNFR